MVLGRRGTFTFVFKNQNPIKETKLKNMEGKTESKVKRQM
jgi:hypothetical protein